MWNKENLESFTGYILYIIYFGNMKYKEKKKVTETKQNRNKQIYIIDN